jgi:Fe-S cluster assembly ATPase SufC
MPDEHLNAEDASKEAVHTAKNAAQAVEVARQTQMIEVAKAAAAETKIMLMESLREVFGEGDQKNPEQMQILVQRIPLICQDVNQIHVDIREVKDSVEKINNNTVWGVRLILGTVILAILKVILLP